MKKFLLLAFVVFFPLLGIRAQTATVSASSPTYDLVGGQITFTVNLAYPANTLVAGFAAKPPANTWTHASTGGTNLPTDRPAVGENAEPTDPISELGWTYQSGLPTSSASFTFVLNYPANLTGNQVVTFAAHLRFGDGSERTNITVPSITLTPTPVAPSITTPPGNVTVNSGASASFSVVASGFPVPTIKWQRSTDNGATYVDVSNGSGFSGAASATLTIAATSPSMHLHRFRAIATNGISPDATSVAATLSVNSAPLISSQPISQAVATGSNATFTVVASGFPSLGYQWRKGGANISDGVKYSGTGTSVLTISSLQAGDEGDYSVVVSNGLTPNATSNNATLSLLPAGWSATHAMVGSGYVPGSGASITITSTLNFTGEISGMGWSTSLPASWSYASSSGNFNVSPTAGTIGTLNWVWTSPPSSPATFTYVVNIPSTETVARTLIAVGTVVLPSAEQIQMFAKPDPLVVSPVLYHTADTTKDYSIDLNELLRVIAFFNTRFTAPAGRVQTGCYKIQLGTPDGFAPDPSLSAPAAPGQAGFASYHAADTDRDGAISLNELLRVIAFFNTRFTAPGGRIQTGFYKPQSGTPDGYAPDPTRAP